jgi:hypothetical protein
MGKPVWLLLPFNPDWRWLLERSDSPWYPTARLFRQPRHGEWPLVVNELAEAVRQFRNATPRIEMPMPAATHSSSISGKLLFLIIFLMAAAVWLWMR